MHLFLANIQENQALLPESEAHHAKRVLRLTIGEQVFVTDGKGHLFEGILQAFTSKSAVVESLKPLPNLQKRSYKIELVVAPTKQIDRIEFLLEKAVEVGLDAFYPTMTFHSERRRIKLERLEKIALSAMKQSLKAEKPEIHDLISFEDFMQQNHFSGQKFIAHCYDDLESHPLKECILPNQSYQFLIGPEGDFSKDEVEMAIQNGFTPISLGNQRMRTETAALSCVMAAHWLHD